VTVRLRLLFSFGVTLDRTTLATLRMQDQNQASMLGVAGGPRRANSFKLDGVPIEDLFSRAALIPSIEAGVPGFPPEQARLLRLRARRPSSAGPGRGESPTGVRFAA
jgi:hypothetical protein